MRRVPHVILPTSQGRARGFLLPLHLSVNLKQGATGLRGGVRTREVPRSCAFYGRSNKLPEAQRGHSDVVHKLYG
jgi:hypothetical protein